MVVDEDTTVAIEPGGAGEVVARLRADPDHGEVARDLVAVDQADG